jgi:ankyrin repeat protein
MLVTIFPELDKRNECPECRGKLDILSPLINKIKEKDYIGIKFIVENNSKSVNQRNEDLETPLTVAIKEKNKNLVELLLNHEANVNLEDKNEELPLELCFKILQEIYSNSSVLAYAMKNKNVKFVEMLIQYYKPTKIEKNKCG